MEAQDTKSVSVGTALDSGWKLLTKDLSTWAILMLIAFVPAVVLNFIFVQSFDVDIYQFNSATAVNVNWGALVLGQILLGIYSVVIASILVTTFIEVAKGKELGDYKNAFKIGMPNFKPVLVASIVVALIVIVGLIFLIVPGIIAAFLLVPAVYIVADTRKPLGEALNLSTKYAQKFFGPILLALLAAIGLSIGVSILSVVFKPFPTVIETFFTSGLSTALQFFLSLSFAVLYLQMKANYSNDEAK